MLTLALACVPRSGASRPNLPPNRIWFLPEPRAAGPAGLSGGFPMRLGGIADARCAGRSMPRRRSRDWCDHRDAHASAGHRVNHEPPADVIQPLADAEQPEPAVAAAGLRRL